MIVDNSIDPFRLIAEGLKDSELDIKEQTTWDKIKTQAYE